jgi:hypothetical protein
MLYLQYLAYILHAGLYEIQYKALLFCSVHNVTFVPYNLPDGWQRNVEAPDRLAQLVLW